MSVREDLRYTKDHEWVGRQGDRFLVGITDFAQKKLGDVIYVELPEVDAALIHGQFFGSVESVKAVAEIYAPCDGTVAQVNGELSDAPELVNDDPYGEGWMIEVAASDPSFWEHLLSAADYTALVAAES